MISAQMADGTSTTLLFYPVPNHTKLILYPLQERVIEYIEVSYPKVTEQQQCTRID